MSEAKLGEGLNWVYNSRGCSDITFCRKYKAAEPLSKAVGH